MSAHFKSYVCFLCKSVPLVYMRMNIINSLKLISKKCSKCDWSLSSIKRIEEDKITLLKEEDCINIWKLITFINWDIIQKGNLCRHNSLYQKDRITRKKISQYSISCMYRESLKNNAQCNSKKRQEWQYIKSVLAF